MHSRYSNVFLFTNMKNATDYFPSILLGVTIIISVSGIPSEVFGHARTSFIFGTSIMILLTCVSAWNTFRKNIKLSWPNILYLCVLSLYLIDFKHPGSLFNTGSFCLLLLYATLICLRQIHYTIIFNSCLCAAVLLAGWGYLQYFKCIPSNSPFFSTDRTVSQSGNIGHNAQFIAGNNAERTHSILQFTEKVPFLSCNCNHRHHLLPSGFSAHLCARSLHIVVYLHFILLIHTISTSVLHKKCHTFRRNFAFHSPIGRSILFSEA